MRANKVAQVDSNRLGELPKLLRVRYQVQEGGENAYESMVAFPSLAKMRLSELKVSFLAIMSGLVVVLSRYSVALHICQCMLQIQDATHTLLSNTEKVVSK
jgi:hypothetical protein